MDIYEFLYLIVQRPNFRRGLGRGLFLKLVPVWKVDSTGIYKVTLSFVRTSKSNRSMWIYIMEALEDTIECITITQS